MNDLADCKRALYAHCQQYVQQRVTTARQAMENAQAAANEESKSSAGDKYETGRAMAQLERDRHAQLLAEARKLEADLSRIQADKPYTTALPGSLVTTDRGQFFISISAGKITLDGQDYFAISPASPVGAALIGLHAGDSFTLNNSRQQILSVT